MVELLLVTPCVSDKDDVRSIDEEGYKCWVIAFCELHEPFVVHVDMISLVMLSYLYIGWDTVSCRNRDTRSNTVLLIRADAKGD